MLPPLALYPMHQAIVPPSILTLEERTAEECLYPEAVLAGVAVNLFVVAVATSSEVCLTGTNTLQLYHRVSCQLYKSLSFPPLFFSKLAFRTILHSVIAFNTLYKLSVSLIVLR
jgi:hypothetical protein